MPLLAGVSINGLIYASYHVTPVPVILRSTSHSIPSEVFAGVYIKEKGKIHEISITKKMQRKTSQCEFL